MAKVKLHRCSWTFLHTDLDACWKVQRALVEQGIEFDIVKHGYGKGSRPQVEQLSGQWAVPILVLDDGELITGSGAIARWARANRPQSTVTVS